MPHAQRIEWYAYPVSPVALRLLYVEFGDKEDVPDAQCKAFAEEPDLVEQLMLSRRSLTSLSVAFEISTRETAPLVLRVAYLAEFEVTVDLEPDAREELLKQTAFYIAPRTIYPYLREFVANVTKRWRGGEIILPYFPLPLEYESEIPPAPDVEEYHQAEMPLAAEG